MSDGLWSLSDPLLNSMANSPERLVVRGRFADICSSVTDPDVTTFAGELLQDSLISVAGHSAAIAVTGLPPRDKLGNLLSEVMSRVSCSQDKFYRLVAILETRNVELSSTLKSDYKLRQNSQHVPQNVTTEEDQHHSGQDMPPFSKKRKEHDPCAEYVTHLRRAYPDPTHIWDPLPQCQHIRLAMIKEKGKRRGGNDGGISEELAKGNVDEILEEKIRAHIDMDKLFDEGIFDEDHQVILAEGGPGMGKTSLAFHYYKKWTDSRLNTFGAVALVHLRDLHLHVGDSTGTCTLSNLLSLASANHMKITKEMADLLLDKLEILLILDGLDELSVAFQRESFISDLLPLVSSQTKILVTSRTGSSLHLHGKVNRVEILGFTTKDIDQYFRSAFLQELNNEDVDSACKNLTNHFNRHPVIHSCCYVPLNAAILAHIYIYHKKTLPVTQFELFREIVLCCIVREQSKHQPERDLKHVSSFEDLPSDLRNQLHDLSELAYEGVKENRVAFTQKELPTSKDLASLGLLLIVPGFGLLGGKCITYNFIHLAVQELLAAYYISQLAEDRHAECFKYILYQSDFSLVLQFYSGFTGLTNAGVQNFISTFKISGDDYSKFCFLTLLNCFFEAQNLCKLPLCHTSVEELFKQLVEEMRYEEGSIEQDHWLIEKLDLSFFPLSPLNCISVRYFLSPFKARKNDREVGVILTECGLDSHFIDLLIGPLPSLPNILECATCVDMTSNYVTDSSIACIAKVLNSSATIKMLGVGDETVTDEGLTPLLEALPRNESLFHLKLEWLSVFPDKFLKKVGEYVRKSEVKLLQLTVYSPSSEQLQSEQAVSNWIHMVEVGGKELIQNCQLEWLRLKFSLLNVEIYPRPSTQRQVYESLVETARLEELKRQSNNLPPFDFSFISGICRKPASV